ncbi:MAG: dUTP diphosphatase [Rhodospirillales bacterium]|nr:dUTP diphosphatase [Rhodospirillales bacterium]
MTSTDQTVPVEVLRLAHGADLPLPEYETSGSAGMDLAAAIDGELILAPGGRAMVPTALGIVLPPGTEAQIRPRSGLAARNGITVLNSPGTVDSDYRDEIKVILINHGEEAFRITRGMRIAQLVVAPVSRAEWRPVTALQVSDRGDGGFGSTGVEERKIKSSC